MLEAVCILPGSDLPRVTVADVLLADVDHAA
jgi:hypothetical protein